MMKRWFFSLALLLAVPAGLHAAYSSLDPQTQKEFNQILDEAFNAYVSKDYTKSMNLFQRALQMVPGDRTAGKGLEESQGKLEEERKEKLKIEKQRKTTLRDQLEKGNWMDAIEQTHWLLSNSLNPPEIQLIKVEVETALRKKLTNTPVASANRLILEGFISYLNFRFTETLKVWKEAKTMVPENVKLSIYIDKAEQMYRRTTYYDTVTVGGQRAKEFFNSGNYEEALRLWKNILQLEPLNREAIDGVQKAEEFKNKQSKEGLISDYYDKGLSSFLENNFEESIKNWEGILAIDPTNEVAKDYILKIKAKGFKVSEQPVTASTAAVTEEKKVGTLYEQAVSLYNQEKFEASKELLLKVLQQYPNDPDSLKWLEKVKQTQNAKAEEHYNQGLIAYSEGQVDLAIQEWQRALEIDPGHAPSQRTLSKVKENKGGSR